MNAYICCLGDNFTVLKMTSRTSNVYPYNPSYKPLYNVTIESGTTTVTDNITVNSFIVIINKALYYGKKVDHSLINPNQFICYVTMVWDHPFDPKRGICLEKCEGGKIDLIPYVRKIGFRSQVPTEEDLMTLPHIKVTSD